MPLVAPKRDNAKISVNRFGATTGDGNNRQSANAAARVVVSLPKRPTDQPANGSTRTEPTAIKKGAMPRRKPPSASRSLTSGICVSQLATTKPFAKKTNETDSRAYRSSGTVGAAHDGAAPA